MRALSALFRASLQFSIFPLITSVQRLRNFAFVFFFAKSPLPRSGAPSDLTSPTKAIFPYSVPPCFDLAAKLSLSSKSDTQHWRLSFFYVNPAARPPFLGLPVRLSLSSFFPLDQHSIFDEADGFLPGASVKGLAFPSRALPKGSAQAPGRGSWSKKDRGL